MTIAGIHRVSFTVSDLERTVDFYQKVLGMRLVGRKRRQVEDDLGAAMCGAEAREHSGAEILIADMELGGTRVEFIEYVEPATQLFPRDPSVAGSAHMAILTQDIESDIRRLKAAGAQFDTPVRTVRDPGGPLWRWCYFRDPDGICVELVESGGAADDEVAHGEVPTDAGAPGPVADREAAGEDRVDREVRLLRSGDFPTLERQSSHRRLEWLTAHGHPPRLDAPLPMAPVSPREAYDLLLLACMGLQAEQVPVVEESADRIVWLSSNDCPKLEACSRLGLDTREICRVTAERPVQTFLSRLDPRLRFVRDYVAIRPYAGHCREQIVRIDVEAMMRDAIDEALLAKAEGNKGYGCLLVMGDRVLAKAHDTAVTTGDPSLHAEHTAILEAVRCWGSPDLTGSLLISTCEPCPMCAGLAVWAGVTTIMFGSSIADTAAMGRARILVGAAEIAERSPRVIEVIGGVLREQCDQLYA